MIKIILLNFYHLLKNTNNLLKEILNVLQVFNTF